MIGEVSAAVGKVMHRQAKTELAGRSALGVLPLLPDSGLEYLQCLRSPFVEEALRPHNLAVSVYVGGDVFGSVVAHLGEEYRQRVSCLIGRVLGYLKGEAGHQILRVGFQDDLASRSDASQEEVAEALLEGRMKVKFGLLEKDQASRFGQEALHDHWEHL